jgi:hypothetical protein
LIIEESASLYQPDLHQTLLRSIIDRYLADYRGDDYPAPDFEVPRFLLNDVARYWRTLTVDYQAKRWNELGRPGKWGMRYLKLLGPRKWTYAGTVASLLTCDSRLSSPEATDFFVRQFSMPPLARLGQLHDRVDGDAREALKRILAISNEFVGVFSSREARQVANKIRSRAELSEAFGELEQSGQDLQSALEILFFDSFLEDKARRFLTF